MNSITRRLIIAAAAVGLVAAIGVAPASAGSSRPAPVVSPTKVPAGQDFTVSGIADCITGSTLTVAITGLGLSQEVSGDAAWVLHFTVPADAVPDTYPVTVSGNECSYPPASVDVVTADVSTTVTTLAPTTTAAPAAAAAVAAQPAFTG